MPLLWTKLLSFDVEVTNKLSIPRPKYKVFEMMQKSDH